MTDEFVCPEAEYHGKPFRYCPVKGCGWMEPVPPKQLSADMVDLRERLMAARDGLRGLACMENADTPRLKGKIEGVELAIDYIRACG